MLNVLNTQGVLHKASLHPVQVIKERPSTQDPQVQQTMYEELAPFHTWVESIRVDRSVSVRPGFRQCTKYETSMTFTQSEEDERDHHVVLHNDDNMDGTTGISASVFESKRDE